MRNIIALFSILLLVHSYGFGQQFESRYSDVKEIQLSTGSADCEIFRSDNGEVGVELYHNLYDNYQPEVIFRDQKLILKDDKYRGNARMRWVLMVTDDIEVKYTAGSGDLVVKNVSIDLTSISGSGNILLSNSEGNYRSNTGSGDIALEKFNGEIKANTGSGDISATDIKGELTLNTGSGDIEMDGVQAGLSLNTGSGDILVKELRLTDAGSFNAGSGTVEITLAGSPAFDLRLNSGSGDAILRRNGHELNADIVMSASKSHGEIIAPYNFDRQEEEGEGRNIVIHKYVSVGSGDKVEIKIGTGSGKAVIR
ncbi:MAG: DUF4097 family beta strand repeat-containing protein [Cyclobacteriaceae bacterium]